MGTYLVVGCGGLIGQRLLQHLREIHSEVYGTCRKGDDRNDFVLDLSDLERHAKTIRKLERLAKTARLTVFLAAGVTGYEQCERNPQISRKVNVTNTCLLAERLLAQGAFVVFLSSNAVFSGAYAVSEKSASDPRSEYGSQKAEVEACLIDTAKRCGAENGVAVVRMTKVLSESDPVMREWVGTLRSGGSVEAAADFMFAPISLQYAVDGLARIGAHRRSGIYHLSGAAAVSYYEFALTLANLLGVPDIKVRQGTVANRLKFVPLPKVGLLGMTTTTHRIGIHPQSVEDAARDLLATQPNRWRATE